MTGLVLAGTHYSILTGSDSAIVNAIPVVLILAAILGVLVALRIKRADPTTYEGIAAAYMRQ